MKTKLHYFLIIAFVVLSLQAEAGVSADTHSGISSDFTNTYRSIGAQDGYILAATPSNLQGGSLDDTSTTLLLGDDNTNKQYRTLLSFDTSNLPENAVLSSAKLVLTEQAMVGSGYPPSLLQGLLLDIRDGYFGDNPALETGDFRANANKSSAGPFHFTAAGNTYSISLTNDLLGYVNKTGPTQFRLRFKLPTNNNNAANYMSFYSGDYSDPSSQPTLMRQYHFPDNIQRHDTTRHDQRSELLPVRTAQGSLDLSWTAPGGDGITGMATDAYLVRYQQQPDQQ